MNPRRLALDLLARIDDDGAYANIVVPAALADSGLDSADRAMVTDLVYGVTRLRRAIDAMTDRFVSAPPDPRTRRLLRLGTYQWAWAGIPPHAAVSETVALAPARTRGFVNAVLRRVVAAPGPEAMAWPSEAVRLSYPDWIHELLVGELGEADAAAAMTRMDERPTVARRADGYAQDRSSQWVAAAVEAAPGERIVDLCAAPGGKATAIATAGADVIAVDLHVHRVGLIRDNATRLDGGSGHLAVLCADGRRAPLAAGSADAVLLDAPCSGLGALRRRADARWRITRGDLDDLVVLQRELLHEAARLVAPGGRLVYSVCTLTSVESTDHPVPDGFEIDDRVPDGVWRPHRHGWRTLPHDDDTDGMVLIRYRRRT
ncbi:MAG: transcription antitermination factor NusB [Ilumatobacteraceae bacterium]